MQIPDHPEIQWIERTGYPSWMQGQEAEDEDIFQTEVDDLVG